MQTIRSRCQMIRFAPVESDLIKQHLMEQGRSREDAEVIACGSGGSVGAERRYQVGNGLQFQLTVSEESRFTSQVILAQHNPELPSYLQARIEIRLYHDVRMAEVCAAQQISMLQPRYDYPNKKMHHRDEKEQVNLFLADWLRFCLKHGTSLINIL